MLKTPTTPPAYPSHDRSTKPASRPAPDPPSPVRSYRSRLWLKSFLFAVLLIGAIAAVGAVLRRSGPEMVAGTTMTHIIKRGDLRVTVTEKGTLESSNNVEVRSKVWGWKTVNWVIESGSIVKKGDLSGRTRRIGDGKESR